MLDWREGRLYEISPKKNARIRPKDVPVALRASLTPDERNRRTNTQIFITDRFDRLFMVVGQLQIAVNGGLVHRKDVEFPLSWYVTHRLCENKALLIEYMSKNSAQNAVDFLSKLEAWRNCPAPEAHTQ